MKHLLAGSVLELPLRRLHAWMRPQQNAIYDLQTLQVMRRVLRQQSNCIDVGCHHGQILANMLRYAPRGRHLAFEPLPALYQGLRHRFAAQRNVALHDCALSDTEGTACFQHVVSNPAYSGLRRRRYDRQDEQVVEITVPVRRLDDLVAADLHIHFLKIDVEGGELQVLRGALRTLARCQPVIVFEHGLGAADWYGSTPEAMHALLTGPCGLDIYLMGEWLQTPARPLNPLSADAFCSHFHSASHYYFMAAPRQQSPRRVAP